MSAITEDLEPEESIEDVSLFAKEGYDEPITEDNVPETVRTDAYVEFAGRHHYDREVDPVFRQTGNDLYTGTGFHTSILGLERGITSMKELADQFSYTLQDGGGEVINPKTLFGGDFYQYSATTTDLVRKVRHDLVDAGYSYPGLEEVQESIEESIELANNPERHTQWADNLDLKQDDGSVILFASGRMTTIEEPSIPQVTAMILKEADVDVGILSQPLPIDLEAYEVNYEDEYKKFAKANVEQLEATGAETVVVCDSHSWLGFQRDYKRMFGGLPFEVTYITDYVTDLLEAGELELTEDIDRTVAYHDSSGLNALSNVWESPRKILEQIPGLTFKDRDHIARWGRDCGYGTSNFRALHPELSQNIGEERLREAKEMDVGELVVACSYAKNQFNWVKEEKDINLETPFILELISEAIGGN
jgi:heterodisulfide reductase subunit D